MSAVTEIAWTDRTWNVVRGCSRVSLGCGGPGRVGGCYAERQAHRFNYPGGPYEGLTRQTENGPRWTGVVRLVPEALDEPLRWRKPARVFVNSMSDLFHEALPFEHVSAVMRTCMFAERHTFQILTKRPERMLAYARHVTREKPERGPAGGERILGESWPLPNVWLGVSVEDQKTADERIPLLLQTPAAKRFVSYEPALGPVDFRRLAHPLKHPKSKIDVRLDSLVFGQPRLDWIIVGGESGPGARAFDVAWARSTVEQCKAAGVACFVKQLGPRPRLGDSGYGRAYSFEEPRGKYWSFGDGRGSYSIRDPKGGDPSEWPEDLRVREFPA